MANISIRGLEPETLSKLKALAKKENTSFNALVLRLLDRSVGVSPEKPLYQRHEDLSELAGAWSQQEAEEFEANTACFSNIDPQQWQ
ncbi:hypothetical protein JJD41_12230 [Oxynema sp. CENA135]|uniref:hypothetical protein n=1 Tax=Oxynema sp. CENA135 TaxID=984206 RepID=UPI00190D9BFB|nr:hypothetical protein [Oxynema sp. CENA135]MBK4730626.1 hypothetical protein [Oxynema sp. CENA135]